MSRIINLASQYLCIYIGIKRIKYSSIFTLMCAYVRLSCKYYYYYYTTRDCCCCYDVTYSAYGVGVQQTHPFMYCAFFYPFHFRENRNKNHFPMLTPVGLYQLLVSLYRCLNAQSHIYLFFSFFIVYACECVVFGLIYVLAAFNAI